jgi:tetratricopeptide (TPR) repeat protein
MTKATQFDSAGFDLDELSAQVSSLENVVMELHADGSTSCAPSREAKTNDEPKEDPEFITAAEQFKQEGNDYYKQQNYKMAHQKYTEAILAVPGQSGADILLKKKQWEDEQHLRVRKELRERDIKKKPEGTEASNSATEESSAPPPPPMAFVLDPPHAYGSTLAVYYGNRAAASLQMAPPPTPPVKSEPKDEEFPRKKNTNIQLQEALDDCTVALLLDPSYLKAYMRRSTIHERMEQTEEALADMRKAQELDPTNATIRKQVVRLQRLEDERLEALKEETVAKLKDLGNSLLSNFGLSLDNFKAQKDPNTGSYNISFQQN